MKRKSRRPCSVSVPESPLVRSKNPLSNRFGTRVLSSSDFEVTEVEHDQLKRIAIYKNDRGSPLRPSFQILKTNKLSQNRENFNRSQPLPLSNKNQNQQTPPTKLMSHSGGGSISQPHLFQKNPKSPLKIAQINPLCEIQETPFQSKRVTEEMAGGVEDIHGLRKVVQKLLR